MSIDEEPQGLTVEEAAKIAKCSLPNIYKAIYGERIKASPVVKGAKAEWRIDEESLREWRRTLKRGRPPKGWPGQAVPAVAPAHSRFFKSKHQFDAS